MAASSIPDPRSTSTLKYVEDVLAAFLADPSPGVLALKGEWGVGKTYLWTRYIERQKKAADCDSYAYASVFGVANTVRNWGQVRNWVRNWGQAL